MIVPKGWGICCESAHPLYTIRSPSLDVDVDVDGELDETLDISG